MSPPTDAPYVLDVNDGESRTGVLRLELDRTNVFEESPTAIILTIEGKPLHDDAEAALDIGPIHVDVDGVRADAVFVLTLAEATATRDALTRLLEAAC